MPRRFLAAAAGVAAAASFVAAASAGAAGSGSLTMASGFTLYAYTYSVQFSQPVRLFEIDFKRRDESGTLCERASPVRDEQGREQEDSSNAHGSHLLSTSLLAERTLPLRHFAII